MENLESYFVKCLGTTKISLAYVIRDDPNVPPTLDDPGTNYTCDIDEMVRRAPHGTLQCTTQTTQLSGT